MKSGEVTGRSAISAPAFLPSLVLPITCPVFSPPPAHIVLQALLKCPLPSPGVRPNSPIQITSVSSSIPRTLRSEINVAMPASIHGAR